MAEMLGIRWYFMWAVEQNFPNLTVETDAETVVLCFRGRNRVAAIDFLIQDCRDIMPRMSNCNIVFVKRSCNLVAHNLVVLAKSIGCRVWVESSPHQIYPFLRKDFNHH